jgi:hypothetical protein
MLFFATKHALKTKHLSMTFDPGNLVIEHPSVYHVTPGVAPTFVAGA